MSDRLEPQMILVAYAELSLKSRGIRRKLIMLLKHNVQQALKENGIEAEVDARYERMFIHTNQVSKAIEVLKHVFGISWYAPVFHVKLDELENFVKDHWKELLEEGKTFAVRVKRVGKHGFTSQQMAAKLGSYITLPVNLDEPQQTLYVEIRQDDCYVFTEKYRGYGGLHVGSCGKVVALVSSGIDSPVACWLMLKRGCEIVALHAKMSDESLEIAKRMVKKLQKWSYGRKIRLFVYDHAEALRKIKDVAKSYTCVLCKRLMYRMAEKLAMMVGAKAIVTGENLGQVASQTLENLSVIDSSIELPVLRPLVGMNKQEIVNLAKEIGTFDVSILQPKKCWALPRKVTTNAKKSYVERLEGKLSIEEIIEETFKTVEEIEI